MDGTVRDARNVSPLFLRSIPFRSSVGSLVKFVVEGVADLPVTFKLARSFRPLVLRPNPRENRVAVRTSHSERRGEK